MDEKVVITGGAGFIGSNLAESLAEESQVVIIDDLSTGKAENLSGLDAELVRGSILDLKLLKSVFQDVDCVFHHATVASVQKSILDPITTSRIGIEGTLNILVAARDAGVGKVVFASSAAVYGDSPELPKKEDMLTLPKSPYAISKLASEHHCQVFRELYGIKTVALRYFNVFGPKQDPSSEYSGVISKFISAVANGNPPTIFGDGEQTRDFVYVKDVVRANICARRSGSGIYNIGSGREASLNQLAEHIGTILDCPLSPQYDDPRPGDIRHSLADISRAKSIGYCPEIPLQDGLRGTIEWFLSSHDGNRWGRSGAGKRLE